MANLFKLRKGLDINLAGRAERKKIQLKSNGKYALQPDCFSGVVPKVVVKEGDKVKAGDALFINKKLSGDEICISRERYGDCRGER